MVLLKDSFLQRFSNFKFKKFVEIVLIYFEKNLCSLSRQAEACNDKIDAGETPHSVSQFWISNFFII